jgi:hypothetical protein
MRPAKSSQSKKDQLIEEIDRKTKALKRITHLCEDLLMSGLSGSTYAAVKDIRMISAAALHPDSQ